MSYLLELLGKGLEQPSLMGLVLPFTNPLSPEEIKMLGEFVGKDPAHAANQLRLGIHYAQSGADERAGAMFRELLEANPEYHEARLAWAAMNAGTGELNQAIDQLEQAYRQGGSGSREGRILFALGFCYEQQGNTEQALKFYHEGCSCKPYLRKTRQRLAAIYLVKKDYDKTIDQCRFLQEQHPEDVWNYLVLGHLYLHTGDFGQAESCFGRALTIEPDNFELSDEQTEALAESGQIDGAIARLRQIIEQQGDFPDSYVRLADLYSRLGEDQQAVNHYQRALEIHPCYLEAAVKLGTQHLRMGRYNEAAGRFNLAVEINDQLIGAYVGLSLAQTYQDKIAQAQETLELAAALQPNTNLLFMEMNRLQLKAAQSQKDARKYLDWDDSNQADIADKDDMLKIQMQRYCRKIEENPNQAELFYHYGLLLWNTGEIDRTIENFQKALVINPSFFRAKIKLSLALREANRRQEAEEPLRQAFQLEQEYIDLHYHLGLMYCDKIKFALAVEHFQDALKSGGQEADVQANLSLALQNMGLIDRAAAAWQAVCELEPQSSLAFQAQRSFTTLKEHML